MPRWTLHQGSGPASAAGTLKGGSRLGGGFRCEVFACSAAGGEQVVVKLTATPGEARLEAAALASWAHTGAAARLIDADISDGALLLERIRPGTPLPGGDDPASVAVAARLLARLHLAADGELAFPALEDIYVRLESRARGDADFEQRTRGDPARRAAGLERLELARAAAMDLCATAERAVLLHGDFLDKNLLRSGAGYLAIDPIPRIGDPCADVGFFAAGHMGWTGSARFAGQRSGLSCRPVRPGATTSPTLKPACPATSSSTCSLRSASSQIPTAAMPVLPGGKARRPRNRRSSASIREAQARRTAKSACRGQLSRAAPACAITAGCAPLQLKADYAA